MDTLGGGGGVHSGNILLWSECEIGLRSRNLKRFER